MAGTMGIGSSGRAHDHDLSVIMTATTIKYTAAILTIGLLLSVMHYNAVKLYRPFIELKPYNSYSTCTSTDHSMYALYTIVNTSTQYKAVMHK